MRFITEFELAEGNINNAHLSIEARKDSEMKIGFAICSAFGWESSENNLRHKIAIEAFPMEKWVEFKQKLFSEIATCNDVDFPVDGARILSWIKELESFGKPSGDAITNLSGQMEYRGPSSHCKACEDEKNGVKHIMAQKHTCRK